MRAARLRHRIQLQQLSEIQDSYGEMVRSYSNYAIVWATAVISLLTFVCGCCLTYASLISKLKEMAK